MGFGSQSLQPSRILSGPTLGSVPLWETVLSSLFQPHPPASVLKLPHLLFQPPGDRQLSFISKKLGKDFDWVRFIPGSASIHCSPCCGRATRTWKLVCYWIDYMGGSRRGAEGWGRQFQKVSGHMHKRENLDKTQNYNGSGEPASQRQPVDISQHISLLHFFKIMKIHFYYMVEARSHILSESKLTDTNSRSSVEDNTERRLRSKCIQH